VLPDKLAFLAFHLVKGLPVEARDLRTGKRFLVRLEEVGEEEELVEAEPPWH
jgi:hypothetical protein